MQWEHRVGRPHQGVGGPVRRPMTALEIAMIQSVATCLTEKPAPAFAPPAGRQANASATENEICSRGRFCIFFGRLLVNQA